MIFSFLGRGTTNILSFLVDSPSKNVYSCQSVLSGNYLIHKAMEPVACNEKKPSGGNVSLICHLVVLIELTLAIYTQLENFYLSVVNPCPYLVPR